MLLSRAIEVTEQYLKTDYPDSRITDGLVRACQHWLRITKCVRLESTVTLTANTDTVNLSITDFKPWRWIAGFIGDDPVAHRSIDDIYDRHRNSPASEQPRMIAWRASTTWRLWPTPDQAYSLLVIYTPTVLDSDVSSGDPALNIPDEFIYDVCEGAAAFVEANNPQALFQEPSYKRFVELANDVAGKCIPPLVHDRQLMDIWQEDW